MRHPTDSTLRRLVDEPVGVSGPDREHVAGCPSCLSRLSVLQGDGSADATGAASTGRRRTWPRGPVVAATGAVVLLATAGVAAAGDWLPVFRAEEVAPVTVTQTDLSRLEALPDLDAYGDVDVVEPVRVRQVADVSAAEDATGLSVPQVGQLPRGVAGKPELQVLEPASMVFTFSAREAGRAAAAAGTAAPTPPPGLDGSRFRVDAGPGVAAMWQSRSGAPALVVARMTAPSVDSSGVPFETARDYLLAQPALPDHVAAQLRALTADASTLPFVVPRELGKSTTADVDGARATVVTSRDGTMAGVVWVSQGTLTAVGGSMSADEVLSVARGLR